jgi:maltooligosyltrehalose trehalohydrolase
VTSPADGRPPAQFVVCAQNHDQIGNRPVGDRLPGPVRRLAAFCVVLSPFVPLLFMGEERGEDRPFLYFTDHDDPDIARATREGRRREFAAFAGFAGEVPDPQDPETFARSVLRDRDPDPRMRALYRDLLALRRRLGGGEAEVLAVDEDAGTLRVRRGDVELCMNLSSRPARMATGGSRVVLATAPIEVGRGALRLPAWSGAALR